MATTMRATLPAPAASCPVSARERDPGSSAIMAGLQAPLPFPLLVSLAMRFFRVACALLAALITLVEPGIVRANPVRAGVEQASDPAATLALDCGNLAGPEAARALAEMPAPRIVILNGSVPIVTMESFARFLIGMGYPAESL